MRLRGRIVLSARPERVWEVLTAWEAQAEWMPDVAWIRLAKGDGGVGSTVLVRTKVFGVPAVSDEMTIDALEPPRRIAISHRGLVRGIGEWRLERFGERTRFTWTEELHAPPPVVGEMGLQLYRPWQAWMLKRSLRNLAARVEGAA